MVIDWPSGRTEEFKNVVTGKAYECVEGKGWGRQEKRLRPERGAKSPRESVGVGPQTH